ncbi:hypothetical protein [Streptomyces tropicalis]|uniref:Secreted protein n=1 Tax=Streptomyces tropicalis TaxID=3034234 RepID=A0ABT6A3R0_9ACTN|nr:hypothetical protein [Streptomyces tropicalis]MDF3299279.1 hypothetical protein [Streptomyces tropicalis]
MGYMIAALGGLASVLAAAVTVLVRRERRRMPFDPEAGRIEAATRRRLRDARRQAHAYHHFADVDGVGSLRNRDARPQ